ncbi:MAG: acyl-CoA thioesterase [Dehalococcoidia bacterium]
MIPETGTVVAHPWLCDVMGHLNARHIYAAFDDAGMVLLNSLGFFNVAGPHEGSGWADVRAEVDFSREVPVGTVLRVRSQITRIGRTSFTQRHELISAYDTRHASALVTTVHFDLAARKAIALPATFSAAATPWCAD